MRITIIAGVVALSTLAAACSPTGSRTGDGALIGGTAGALAVGLATHNVAGAVIGGVGGAMLGAIIADATGKCYKVGPNGTKTQVPCPK